MKSATCLSQYICTVYTFFGTLSLNRHAGSVSVCVSWWQASDCQQSYAVFSTAVSLSVSHAFGFQSHASRPLSPHHQGLLFTTEGPHTISRQGSRPVRPSLPLSLGSSSLLLCVESSLLSASQCTAGQGFSWIHSGIFNYCPCPVTCTFFFFYGAIFKANICFALFWRVSVSMSPVLCFEFGACLYESILMLRYHISLICSYIVWWDGWLLIDFQCSLLGPAWFYLSECTHHLHAKVQLTRSIFSLF